MKTNLLIHGATRDHVASDIDAQGIWHSICGRASTTKPRSRWRAPDRRVCSDCIRALAGSIHQDTAALADYQQRGRRS